MEDLHEQWRRYLSVREKSVTSETNVTPENLVIVESGVRPAFVTDVTEVTLNTGTGLNKARRF